jgi:class 3 adenylate cyclase
MTPAENFDFINSFLRRFSPIIRRFNGFIDKFIGDAIMAIFSQNPADAVNASILMQRRLSAYNLRLGKQGRQAVHIGIGIHSGKLMLGTVGEEKRMEGTVISDVVNTASRLEGLTKAFGVKIIISGDVYESIRSSPVYRVRYLGAIRVKGKSLPVKIYEVLNAYPREIQKSRLATRERLEAAIGSFARRDHKAARTELESILREDPEDPVARYYWQTLQEKLIS